MAKTAKTVKKSTRRRGNVVPLTDRYLYVEVRGWFRDVYAHNQPENPVGVLDGAISFDSIIVQARSEDDAYSLGVAQLQERQDADTPRDLEHPEDFEAGSHVTGDFLNDYVVKL